MRSVRRLAGSLTIPEQRGGWVDVDGMMAAADRAGINPISFINAGGLSAYSQTWITGQNAADAFKLMAPEYQLTQASQVPQQHSMLSAFGGALSAGASAFGTQYRADQSYDLQMTKMLGAFGQMGMGLSGSNGLSTAISYGGTGGGFGTAGIGSGKAGGLSDLPYPSQWERGKVEVTNPHRSWSIDSTAPDAEMYETRYGDLMQEVFGIANLAQDAVRATTGRTLREWGIASGMSLEQYHKGSKSIAETVGRWWNDPAAWPSNFIRNPATQKSYGTWNTAPLFPGAY